MWRTAGRYDSDRGSTRTWLLAIVRNRSISVLRARRGQRPATLDQDLPSANGMDLLDQVVPHLDAEIARKALASVPIEQRQAIELAYFEGLTHSEIATRLSLPLGFYGAHAWDRPGTAYEMKARTPLRVDFTPDIRLVLNATWDVDEIGSRRTFDGGNVMFEGRWR